MIKNLITRTILAVLIAIFGFKIIYAIISPITFYLSSYSLFFYKPTIIQNTLIIKDNLLTFVPACAAASAYVLLALLTVLTDIKYKKMLKIFLIGALIILIANIIRIDILVIALIESGSDLFNKLHLLFWKILSTIFVVVLWIFLTKIYKIKSIPVYTDIKKLLRNK